MALIPTLVSAERIGKQKGHSLGMNILSSRYDCNIY